LTYLVDSDYVIDYLSGDAAARNLLNRLSAERLAIGIITHSEIYEGVIGSRDPRAAERAFARFSKR
jgi:predicted nucleic acid-binding protein